MAGRNRSQRSTQTHRFSEVPNAEIPRSSFDRSSGYKTTMDTGQLIPFFVDEALPGDTFNLRTSGFARMATPIFPIMDNMQMDTFYFAVPCRILWDNWVKMMGEQDNPEDSTDFITPEIQIGLGLEEHSLGDYFGIPTEVTGFSVSALPSRAYQRIWQEWFRDQNLQDSPDGIDTGDGPDSEFVLAVNPERRNKKPDYFTSALPFPQKGPDVEVPLGGTVFVKGMAIRDDFTFPIADALNMRESGDLPGRTYLQARRQQGDDSGPEFFLEQNPERVGFPFMRVDLEDAASVTVNALRQSFQIQKMFERDARGGSRYIEILRSHFGVTSPDMRQQRPEYLGGGTSMVNISPVHSTAETDPQGNPDGRSLGDLSAVGTVSFTGHGFTKSFTEHCIIIGLVTIRADLTYQQGLNRMWARSDRFDYYWPALSHLGEQEILNQEIFITSGDTELNESVFGYQERYAEYRFKPSIITGQFRSNSALTLDAWHLAEEFDSLPTLSAAFIPYSIPLERCIAVADQPHFICDFYHKLICARPMPLYGVPGNIDRF